MLSGAAGGYGDPNCTVNMHIDPAPLPGEIDKALQGSCVTYPSTPHPTPRPHPRPTLCLQYGPGMDG